MSSVENNKTNFSFCENTSDCLFWAMAVTVVALAVIGVLAENGIGELSALSADWYYFEIAAGACLAAYVIKSCCEDSPEVQIPTYQNQESARVVEQLPEQPKTPEEIFRAAKKLEQNKQYSEAFTLYFEAGQAGHLRSICKVAEFQNDGRGIVKSVPDAKNNYRSAANAGDLEAIYKMAFYASESSNWDEVADWLTKAKSNGCEYAQGMLDSLAKIREPNSTVTATRISLFTNMLKSTSSFYVHRNALRN